MRLCVEYETTEHTQKKGEAQHFGERKKGAMSTSTQRASVRSGPSGSTRAPSKKQTTSGARSSSFDTQSNWGAQAGAFLSDSNREKIKQHEQQKLELTEQLERLKDTVYYTNAVNVDKKRTLFDITVLPNDVYAYIWSALYALRTKKISSDQCIFIMYEASLLYKKQNKDLYELFLTWENVQSTYWKAATANEGINKDILDHLKAATLETETAQKSVRSKGAFVISEYNPQKPNNKSAEKSGKRVISFVVEEIDSVASHISKTQRDLKSVNESIANLKQSEVSTKAAYDAGGGFGGSSADAAKAAEKQAAAEKKAAAEKAAADKVLVAKGVKAAQKPVKDAAAKDAAAEKKAVEDANAQLTDAEEDEDDDGDEDRDDDGDGDGDGDEVENNGSKKPILRCPPTCPCRSQRTPNAMSIPGDQVCTSWIVCAFKYKKSGETPKLIPYTKADTDDVNSPQSRYIKYVATLVALVRVVRSYLQNTNIKQKREWRDEPHPQSALVFYQLNPEARCLIANIENEANYHSYAVGVHQMKMYQKEIRAHVGRLEKIASSNLKEHATPNAKYIGMLAASKVVARNLGHVIDDIETAGRVKWSLRRADWMGAKSAKRRARIC
jgi:hypothetical protein